MDHVGLGTRMAEEDPPPPQELLVILAPMATASADHFALEKREKSGDFHRKMVISMG